MHNVTLILLTIINAVFAIKAVVHGLATAKAAASGINGTKGC